MKRHWWAVPVLAMLAGAGAAQGQTASQRASVETESASKAIPITTASEKARQLYVEAQALGDKLHNPQAHAKYQEAVAADKDFAMGYYGLAISSPTTSEFLENLKHAVALSSKVSQPEQHMILALEAASNSDPAGQLKHLQALVQAVPNEARAHFLLANYEFGRQDYQAAVEHDQKAVELDPSFSPAYNILGYSYRQLGTYDEAENAFKKYIEVLPDEPNPYDSYAELLMRMGRFDESIEMYRKALSKDPSFVFSMAGIGNDQMFLGKFDEARKTFQQLYDQAPNDGVRRTALFWTAASYVHQGNRDKALETLRTMSTIAEKGGDKVSVSGDLGLMGNILVETGGSPDEALATYKKSIEVMESADAPEEVKEAARRNMLWDEGQVALLRKDMKTAKAKVAAYREAAEARGVPGEIQQAHELSGRIALAEGDVDTAIAELQQANLQDPRILWDLSRAYEKKGDSAKAAELAKQTAEYNQLNFNYAFVRWAALEKVGMKT